MSRAKPFMLMRKEKGRLVPLDSWSSEQLAALPEGKDLRVVATGFRSHAQLGLFWAGLALAVDNFDSDMKAKYPTSRHLYRAVLIALGHSDMIFRVDGSAYVVENSVSFEALSQQEMNQLMDRVRLLFIGWIGYDPFQAYIEKRAS